jgi:hypothetical protein
VEAPDRPSPQPSPEPSPGPSQAEIAAAILHLVETRGAEASICPSEVARGLCPADVANGRAWQSLMGPVRQAAVALALAGRIHILRKGRPVDPRGFRGVIRLRLRPPGTAAPDWETNRETDSET